MSEPLSPTPKTVTIYGFDFSPYVRAARIYAEEVAIPHTNSFTIQGVEHPFKSAGHLAINPFGKVPVLIDGENAIFETASICRYLDTKAGSKGLISARTDLEKAHIDQWSGAIATCAQDALMRGFFLEIAFPKGEGGAIRWELIQQNLPEAKKFLQIIEHQLTQHQWITGDHYSMADSILTPMLHYMTQLPATLDTHPLIAKTSHSYAYLQRLLERPSAAIIHS